MKINKKEIEEWLKLVKNIRNALGHFKANAEELNKITNSYSFYGINNDILNVVTEKYEFGDLVIDNGEIYKITQRLPQTDYENQLGIKHFIGRKIKFNLELENQEYEIEEEYDAEEDMSMYIITPKEKE